ncbi:double-strand break repair helicase AddA [Fodinicurvata sp. EGI_FJ10296]|uniref:double-strand break repair helicase AddA n=1 Tax=Fodinicurvata sp. EGI_FJ10296 TaxID=3231908 RepID=UPI0034518156
MSAPAVDPDIPQRRAADPSASVWVAASAGTGKTRVLTNRVLRLMLAGTAPERILCITFTKAAASEMANRVNEILAEWATIDDAVLSERIEGLTGETPDPEMRSRARRLFARVLDAPGGMKIQTIHAFCQSLLRRFPIEAGVSPHFEPADERSAGDILRQARDGLLLSRDQRVAKALTTAAALTDESGFLTLMNSIVADRSRVMHAVDAAGGLDPALDRLAELLDVPPDMEGTSIIAAACADAALDADGLRRILMAIERAGTAKEKEKAAVMADFLADPDRRADRFEAWCACFLTRAGEPRAKPATKAVLAADPVVATVIADETDRLLRLKDRLCRARLHAASRAYLVLGHALLEKYEALKEARGILDFDDLIMKTADLLTGPGVAPWVLYKLDGGLDHILIDEAQDTNPDQWRVVAALSAEFFTGYGLREDRDGVERTIFAVGDEKQSIYSFQGADVAEFGRMRRLFAQRVADVDRLFDTVDLQVSFRSTPAILDMVNAVFADPTARDGLSEDGGAIPEHVAHRAGQAGLVEIWPLVEKQDTPDAPGWETLSERIAQPSPARRVARAVADTVRGWLDAGRPLAARGRPVAPGDVLILVRTRGPFFHDVVRALKETGVPVAGADRMILSQQMAIMDLLALARFALLSRDDLVLAGLLKSPFIGLTDEDLIDLAPGRNGSLWHALKRRAVERSQWEDARRWLGDILARVDYLTPFELFSRVLDHPCPADAVSGRRALIRRLGQEAEDPLDEFLSLSLSYEAANPPSLQGFLSWLDSEETDIKREQGGDAGVVRVMTVHGAKGLQAPIVFLPDTVGRPRTAKPVHWAPFERSDMSGALPLWVPNADVKPELVSTLEAAAAHRQMQEHRRLLYVALTRAEDELYVCGFSTGKTVPDDCWYTLCRDAAERLPSAESAAMPLLDFRDGQDGPAVGIRAASGVAAPGSHSDARPESPPAARPELGPSPSPSPPQSPVSTDIGDWMFEPAPTEPHPPRPLVPSRPDTDEPAVRSPLESGVRPDRFKRGRVMHTLLQMLPAIAPEGRAAATERYLAARSLDLSDDERADYRRKIMAVLDDPQFAVAFGPGSRAEVPVVGRIAGRGDRARPFILSGQIDRLAVGEREVLIVDYKTNRSPPDGPDGVAPHYIGQIAAYRAALAPLYPGRVIRCALLWTDTPEWMAIPEAMLDDWYPRK